jgi:hypothetical protein
MQALSQLSYTPTKGAHYTGRISLCKEWETALFDNEIFSAQLVGRRTVIGAKVLSPALPGGWILWLLLPGNRKENAPSFPNGRRLLASDNRLRERRPWRRFLSSAQLLTQRQVADALPGRREHCVAHAVFQFLADLLGLVALSIRPRRSLEAEDLFLRRQLALY